MSYEKALQDGKISIGTKQTVKAILGGNAAEVYLAKDAAERILTMITTHCKEMGVKVVYVDSMILLGKACGIEVGAAAAATFKK